MLPHSFFEQRGLLKAFPGFLSPDQAADWVRQLSKLPSMPAAVYKEPVPGKQLRKTQDLLVPASLQMQVVDALLGLLPELNPHFQASAARIQLMQFLRYNVGDYFGPHQDWYENMVNDMAPRQISFVLFLNSPLSEQAYQGGELVFYQRHPQTGQQLGLPLLPEPGMLITFHPRQLHEVRPVTAGSRFSIAGWFF